MNITVFGGSLPRPGETAYQEALHLGRLLGSAGHTVLTGGYIGTMEAISRGAAKTGGRVIGVTCDEIEKWRPVQPNQWINEEKRFSTLKQRLFSLIEECDAALALPGGIGTLAEITIMWSHMQKGSISARPLILIGPGWLSTIEAFYSNFGDNVSDNYRLLLTFAPDVETAYGSLNSYLIGKV